MNKPSLAGLNILITRPQGQANYLLGQLDALGARVEHLPTLSIESVVDKAAITQIKETILALDNYQHVVFISVNAAHQGLEWIDRYWPQWPQGVQAYAVGESTAAVLKEYGLAVKYPRQNMSSEGLLALPDLQQVAEQRCLVLRGVGGRELLRDTLTARGALVDSCAMYQRALCVESGPLLKQWAAAESVAERSWLILSNSLESLGNMLSLAEGHVTWLKTQTLLVPSDRMRQGARDMGFASIRCASSATDRAMIEALINLQLD